MRILRGLGLLALFLGFAQVVFGAIVRITGSGMGCGDHWPDCYGYFTPAHSGSNLLVEISHRYGAAALSLAIAALVVAAWLRRREPGVEGPGGVLRASLLAILLVVVAALFGAVTVKLALHPWVVVTHLAIAMSLLAVLVVAVVRAGGLGSLAVAERYARTFRSARAAAGLTFLVLVMGALTANTPGAPLSCQGFPWCRVIGEGGAPLLIQATHRILAFLLLGHLIGVAIGVRKRAEPRPIRRAAWTSLSIVLLQILVAAAMVEMHLPPSLRSIHQAVGTALWISVITLAALANGQRFMNDIERIVYESPSRGQFATPEGVST
ncbi:MAG TPA: COX15/CtaA family protein [Gemmatimonadaceae bacterium]|nr:COX15/CtaA family protein [Gemmatimonadaceae bacterium]